MSDVNNGGQVTNHFKIGGVFAEKDKESIEYTLNSMDGVYSATVNSQDKTVGVQYDKNRITRRMLTSTLQSLGHSILDE